LLAAACAGAPAPDKSDWERKQEARDWRESDVSLPAAPRREHLLAFFVSAASNFDFYVDGASLSIGKDGVVRYVLVARSPQGAQSVTFEGIRCSSAAYRIYATGEVGGGWSRAATPWRPIEPRSVQRWHNALRDEYFCPLGNPIRSPAEGIDALRRGGHPSRAPSGN